MAKQIGDKVSYKGLEYTVTKIIVPGDALRRACPSLIQCLVTEGKGNGRRTAALLFNELENGCEFVARG